MYGRRGRGGMRAFDEALRPAPRGAIANSKEGREDGQLLRLSIQQVLDPQYVFEQTRGTDSLTRAEDSKADENDENIGPNTLISKAMGESRTEHLTSGFTSQVLESGHVLSRLSRELAALGLSADVSYQTLANKRSIMLERVYIAYEHEYRKLRMSSSRKRKFEKESHPIIKIGVASGVHVMLALLEDAARNNYPLCITILDFLKQQLALIPAMSLAVASSLPAPEISTAAFEQIHNSLYKIANAQFTNSEISSRCLELLVGVACSRGSLAVFLSVLKLLLFKVDPKDDVKVLSQLQVLRTMRREVHMDLPVKQSRDVRVSFTDVSSQQMSMATDGTYLYVHSKSGLAKIGTGHNNTTPGMIYGELKGYRSFEKSSLACVGEKLFYRSTNIAPASLLVLSCKYLTEIGHVMRNGQGTYKTADNSHVSFGPEQLNDEFEVALNDDDVKVSPDEQRNSVQAQLEELEVQIEDAEDIGDYDTMDYLESRIDDLSLILESLQPPGGMGYGNNLFGGGGGFGGINAQFDLLGSMPQMGTQLNRDASMSRATPVVGLTPLMSDGRFLYAVVPGFIEEEKSEELLEKKDKDKKPSHCKILCHAFDPEKELENCHSVPLRRSVPSGETTLLKFGKDGKRPTTSKRRRGQVAQTQACVNMGAPAHLDFSGSLTMECWVKVDNDLLSGRITKKSRSNYGNVHGMFCHGDGSFMTYMHFQNQNLVVGAVTPVGSADCRASILDVDPGDWIHVAGVYDQDTSQWHAVINGNRMTSTHNNIGPHKTAATWTIGSNFQRPFEGYICEARIWSTARTEEEIQTSMKTGILEDTEGLVGFWPLNDGIGLTVRDLSLFHHSGTVKECSWVDRERPFPNTFILEEGEEPPIYSFQSIALAESIWYTNGECLAVIHPNTNSLKEVFPGCAHAVMQIFSVETGHLLEEAEHEFVETGTCACMAPSSRALWLHMRNDDFVYSHKMTVPLNVSPWRAERIQVEEEKGGFPTARSMRKVYPVPGVDDHLLEKGESDEIKIAEAVAADVVSANVAAFTLLSRIEEDCEMSSTVDPTAATPSLTQGLGVELCPSTFHSLVEMIESLAEDYFKKSLSEYGEHEHLRMYAFITCLKALRTNIEHLVGWNVNPSECGFHTETVETVTDMAAILSKANFGNGVALQHRYVDLLNKLIFKLPQAEIPLLISQRVHEQVSESLSVGLSVFYGVAADRVGILFDLVSGSLDAGFGANPLRMLLMSRYFASLSQPSNVIGLLPALISMFEEERGDTSGTPRDQDDELPPLVLVQGDEKTNQEDIGSRGHERSKLLDHVFTLVLDDTQKHIDRYVANNKADEEQSEQEKSRHDYQMEKTASLIATLRDFLVRVQVSLFSRSMETQADSTYNRYAMPYAMRVISSCADLFESCAAKVDKMDQVDERRISTLAFFGVTLRDRVGSLLPPILSSLWSRCSDLTPEAASEILPTLYRLLSAVHHLISRMPDIAVEEKAFVEGKIQRLVVPRNETVETTHPVPQGISEKHVTIAGAKEMLLEFDKRCFQSRNPGVSVTLYRRPGQQEPIENGNFMSLPDGPVRVKGDTVSIVYNSGYQSGAWGFKVTAKAMVEEVSVDIPWMLDLCKNIGLLSGKCAGVLIRGNVPLDEETEAESSKWLNSELFGEGMEYSAKDDSDEREQLSWLPLDVGDLPDATPYAHRADSYEDVDFEQLHVDLAKRMVNVRVQNFPTPHQVKAIISLAIHAVLGVLVKHNLLVEEAQDFIKSSHDTKPSDNLVRVWRTAHRLRRWLLQKFQQRRSGQKEGDPELDRNEVYTELAEEVMCRCRFLNKLVPVPREIRFDKTKKQPSLTRQRSNPKNFEMTDEQKKARDTFLAWQSTREKIELRYAGTDERFSLLWKLVLGFVNDDIKLDKLEQSIVLQRQRARVRAFGLRMMRGLLDCVKLSSVRREIVASLVASLGWTDKDVLLGSAPEIMFGLHTCGGQLKEDMHKSFEYLYETLTKMLMKPSSAGSSLLQAVLHTFSLKYTEDQFKSVVKLGIFPALHRILQSGHVDPKSNGFDNGEDEEKASAVSSIPQTAYQTSAWALLDMLTIQILSEIDNTFGGHQNMDAVYEILLSQLDKIASQLELAAKEADTSKFVPQLPTAAVQETGDVQSKSSQMHAIKVQSVLTFGIETTSSTSGTEQSSETSGNLYADSFTIKVLNLVANICRTSEGRIRVGKVLNSILKIVRFGSSRSKVVTMRILRTLLTGQHAPSVTEVDACFPQEKESSGPGPSCVSFMLGQIGKAFTAPAFAAIAADEEAMANEGVQTLVHSLGFAALHSSDCVAPWSEEVSLLRYLAADSQAWQEVINSSVESSVLELPELLKMLSDLSESPSGGAFYFATDQSDMIDQIWRCIGALCVCGGYIDILRVGARVYYTPEGIHGTVVSRDCSRETVGVLRDGEGSVISCKTEELICFGDVPFSHDHINLINTTEIMGVVSQILKGLTYKNQKHELEKKQKEYDLLPKISVSSLLMETLRSHSTRLLYSLCLSPEHVEQFVQSHPDGLKGLIDAATQICPQRTQISTGELEDRLNLLGMETALRARGTSDIIATVRDEEPRIHIHSPNSDFNAEYTSIGGKIKRRAQSLSDPVMVRMTGPLSYVKINEEPTEKLCKGNLVIVDTYGNFRARLVKLIKAGASAIILALHSDNVKAEGLSEKKKDRDKSGGNVVDQARRQALVDATMAAQNNFMDLGMARRGRGGFGLGRRLARRSRPGNPLDLAAGTPSSYPEEKEEYETKEEQDELSEEHQLLLKSFPIIAVPKSTAKLFRVLLAVKEEDDPEALHHENLVKEMVSQGYEKEHTMKALEKNNFNVEMAGKWLEDNLSWLKEQDEESDQDVKYDGHEDDVPETEISEDGWNLEFAWDKFSRDTTDGAPQQGSYRQAVEGKWHKNLSTRPTYSLLQDVMGLEISVLIHYARRALVSIFVHYPKSNGLDAVGSKEILQKILHMALSLDDHQPAELHPEKHITGRDFRRELIRVLDSESGPYLSSVMREDCVALLEKTCSRKKTRKRQDLSKIKTEIATVTGRYGQGQSTPGIMFEMLGARTIHLTLESDPNLVNLGTVYVALYANVACSDLISTVVMQSNASTGNSDQTQVIQGSQFWYTCQSPNWYQGCPQANITLHAKDIGPVPLSDGEVIDGNIGTALTFMNVLLRTRQPSIHQLLLLLLQSLAYVNSRSIAQDCCRTAAAVFNHWDSIVCESSGALAKKEQREIEEIAKLVRALEDAHAALRTSTLIRWNQGALPGPHLQTLLELVLAARRALPKSLESIEEIAAKEKIPSSVLECYQNYRDGQSLCSMVSLSYRKVVKDMHIINMQQSGSYVIENLVGDVCIRGGKWFYEVKFDTYPHLVCIGWVDREYRLINCNQGLSADYTGHSWSLTGPNTQYMHRGRQCQPQRDENDKSTFFNPNWQNGITVGVLLDMEKGQMSYMYNGKNVGVCFDGFDVDIGLYPAISLGVNCSCVINYGRENFEYPPDPDLGFAPLEHSAIKTSSWLTRYKHASEVTHLLYQRSDLPKTVIEASLEHEVSVDANHDLRFEVVQTDGNSANFSVPEVMLTNDQAYYQPNKKQNCHVTFKIQGVDDAEFVIRELQVRCSSIGFYGLVFVSQNKPDFDSFQNTDDWKKTHYDRFVARKKAKRQMLRSHEPIAFFSTQGGYASCKIDPPGRGQYLTIKFSALQPQNGLFLEFVKFNCIHGSHPLGSIIGTPLAERKTKEIIEDLRVGANSKDPRFSQAMDEGLVTMVQTFSNRLGVSPGSLDAVMLTPTPEDLTRFKNLSHIPLNILRARFSLLKYLNRLVTPLLHYIDVSLYDEINRGNKTSLTSPSKKDDKEDVINSLLHDDKSLSYVVHQLKGYYFMTTKKAVFDTLLATGNAPVSKHMIPSVTVNRLKASKAKENPTKDPDGLKSVFGQIFSQLRHQRYESFRGNKDQQMWNVHFSGEGSIDIGGPYRESVANICADLQSDAAPLFVLCPNGRNSVGLNREKWIVSPSATSSLHMAMYEFVGVLMGIALRTKNTIALDFPSITWKQLLGEKIDVTDLEGIDKLCVQALSELENLDKDKFELLIMEKFTTQLSDGSEVDLKTGGSEIPVTAFNRKQYAELVVKSRLKESEQHIKAIRKGLNSVVPLRMLSLFSWYDLEVLVCGNPVIDVEQLRRHTLFQGLAASSSVVKYLWKALHSFNQEERQLFLRFVWGRNRLPATEGDWTQQFTIKALKASDESLPIAHTCFFSLDLPNYSSYEILRNKILFAVYNCQAIDVDFNPNSSSLTAWVDAD